MADPTIRARATSYHDERGGPMELEAALALTTALTLTAGAKPEVLIRRCSMPHASTSSSSRHRRRSAGCRSCHPTPQSTDGSS